MLNFQSNRNREIAEKKLNNNYNSRERNADLHLRPPRVTILPLSPFHPCLLRRCCDALLYAPYVIQRRPYIQ